MAEPDSDKPSQRRKQQLRQAESYANHALRPSNRPGLALSLAPVVILLALLSSSVLVFGEDATGGPSQIALFVSGLAAAGFALQAGCSWKELETQIFRSVGYVTQAIFILLMVGALIGTWILGGIVPALIVWGLELLSPQVFLAAACIICALVSLATGSSWSTAGTLGLAMIGIGGAMGVNPAHTAGAVISGAYFGDKMSPFSETTNLASGMTGVPLFDHIRHMLWTTLPAMAIALTIYVLMGLFSSAEGYDPARVETMQDLISVRFNTAPYVLLPIPLLFVLIARRMPAIPALFLGALVGALFAVVFQREAVLDFVALSGEGGPALNGGTGPGAYLAQALGACVQAAATGFVFSTGDETADRLLSSGGMEGMLGTIWLILAAMFFSGVMEGAGMLHRIAESILRAAKGAGNLIAATLGGCVFLNLTASEQYLSIVISGRMYREAYEREGLHPKNLSRALEDSGTLTSALIPWNTCGAYMKAALGGVSAAAYFPFAFLNWLVPLISLIYGYAGITIERRRRDAEDKSE